MEPDQPQQKFAVQPQSSGHRKNPSIANQGQGKSSWMIWLGASAAVLILLLIGATFIVPYIVPPETIKRQISAVLKEKTGRDISLKGKLSYRFFPTIGLDLNNIIIHNPPEIKGPDFLNLARLQVNLKLWPLLQKRVEVDRIILHRAELALITNKAGKTNYEFKTARAIKLRQGLRSFRVAQAGTVDTSDIIARTLEKLEREEKEAELKAGKKGGDDTSRLADPKGPKVGVVQEGAKRRPDASAGNSGEVEQDIIIGEIKIINGAVKLIDEKAKSETDISAINLTLNAPSKDKPIKAKGALRFLEDRISLNAEFKTLQSVLSGEPADTIIAMNSDRFEGQFNGKVKLLNGLKFTGIGDVQTYSLKDLLNWLGADVPKKGYGASYIRGTLSGNATNITLDKAKVKIDQNMLQGVMGVRMGGARPRIEAQLASKLLDLSPYTAQKSEIKRGSLESGRQTAVAAWNSSKIDLSFINLIDGNVLLKADKLIASGHTIEQSTMAMKVNAGHLTLDMPKFKIYGGDGVVNLVVNAAKARPSMKSIIDLHRVQVRPLLKNAAGVDLLSGLGDVKVELASSGNSESEMISALNGVGQLNVADGALEGINIPAMLRKLTVGNLLNKKTTAAEKTDFSSLAASFTIDKGIVQNKDLKLLGPLLRLTGAGEVNLPREHIDYGVRPKIVGSLAGQGGAGDLLGLDIPIRLKGPLSSPQIIPDTKALAENGGKAIEDTVKSVETVVKKLKKKKISGEEMKNLLDGMIDGNKEGGNILDNILQ